MTPIPITEGKTSLRVLSWSEQYYPEVSVEPHHF